MHLFYFFKTFIIIVKNRYLEFFLWWWRRLFSILRSKLRFFASWFRWSSIDWVFVKISPSSVFLCIYWLLDCNGLISLRCSRECIWQADDCGASKFVGPINNQRLLRIHENLSSCWGRISFSGSLLAALKHPGVFLIHHSFIPSRGIFLLISRTIFRLVQAHFFIIELL